MSRDTAHMTVHCCYYVRGHTRARTRDSQGAKEVKEALS